MIAAVDAGAGAMYAASRPDRVSALILIGAAVFGGVVLGDEQREVMLELVENHWGEGRFASLFAPSRAGDPAFVEWWARFERSCVSPSVARKLIDLNFRADLSGVLPAIRVPTLVLQQRDSPLSSLEAGREAAELIPGARFVEAEGTDSYDWPGADDPETDLIEEFLTGRTAPPGPGAGARDRAVHRHRRLHRSAPPRSATEPGATLLGPAQRARARTVAAATGAARSRPWASGFLATFDGPARAVRCA